MVAPQLPLPEEYTVSDEVWVALSEFPTCYVSSFGRYRSHTGKIMAGSDRNGCVSVKVRDIDGKDMSRYLHSLVASAFVPNPGHRRNVYHLDGIKTNNNPENLAWGITCSSPEEWKTLDDYPSYKVSSLGRVKAPNEHISRSKPGPDGYITPVLVNNKGESRRTQLHLLVAKAFIPNSDKLTGVEHINGDKADNVMTNLKWCPGVLVSERKGSRLIKTTSAEGYPGYLVSTMGEVTTPYGKVAELTPDAYTGYVAVRLVDEKGTPKIRRVHNLVATAFIPRIEGKSKVNHINGNRADNRTSNLEWVTSSENNFKSIFASATQTGRSVAQYTMDWTLVKVWPKMQDIIAELKLVRANLTRCCKAEKTDYAGFRWRYGDEMVEIKDEKWASLTEHGLPFHVSTHGRLEPTTGRKTFGAVSGDGYMQYHKHVIHYLVALAFISNPEGKPIVDHIDEDRTNNYYANLRWATKSENSRYSFTSGSHANGVKVAQYTLEGTFVKTFATLRDAANVVRVCGQTIANACKYDRTTTGFRWRFVK